VALIAAGIVFSAMAEPALAKKHKNQNNNATSQPANNENTDNPDGSAAPAEQTAPDAVAQAEAALNAVIRRLTAAFESSDKFKAALQDLDQSQLAYDDAVKPVLVDLANNANYQTTIQQSEDTAKAIDAARQSDAPDQNIGDLAQHAMELRMEAAKIKNDALAANPDVVAAKTKLTTAGATLRQLRQDFLTSMKNDPDYIAAKQALDQARGNAANSASRFAVASPGTQPASDGNP
jgi:hypothetical protein